MNSIRMAGVRSRILAASISAALVTSVAGAEEFEQRGTHEHGKVIVNVVIDGSTFAAELVAPAINVVGFERAPKDATEKKVVADAEAWLKSGRNAFAVPKAAGCKLATVDLKAPDLAAHAGHDHDHDHKHGDDHKHEGEHKDDEAHADYTARMSYQCANVAAINSIDLLLLKRLPGTEEATVNIVTPATQTSVTATPAVPRVSL
jgi:hypothetical protein